MILNYKTISELNDQYGFCEVLLDEKTILEHKVDNPTSELNNIPVLYKDNGKLSYAPIVFGNKALHEQKKTDPLFPLKSNVQNLLEAAGTFSVGTTATPELSLSTVTENTWRQPPISNPWDQKKATGGSTGGGALACAIGAAPICIGSDGGGSTRMPASLNGVLGIKPTRGRISRGPLASTNWDGIAEDGILTRDVKTMANTLQVISQTFVNDSFYHENNILDYKNLIDVDLKNIKIGFTAKVPGDLCDISLRSIEVVNEAVDFLTEEFNNQMQITESYPTKFDDISIREHFLSIVAANTAKSASDIMHISGAQLEDLEPETQYFYELGQQLSASDHIRSIEEMYSWSSQCKKWWEDFDVLLTPATASDTPNLGDYEVNSVEVSNGLTAYTYLQNINGLPSLTIPWDFPVGEGVEGPTTPMGIMLTGAPYQENLLLKIASLIEEARPWHHHYSRFN